MSLPSPPTRHAERALAVDVACKWFFDSKDKRKEKKERKRCRTRNKTRTDALTLIGMPMERWKTKEDLLVLFLVFVSLWFFSYGYLWICVIFIDAILSLKMRTQNMDLRMKSLWDPFITLLSPKLLFFPFFSSWKQKLKRNFLHSYFFGCDIAFIWSYQK